MITKATIKFGDIELYAYQIEDGSYASPGLFRLLETDIYQYQEAWYWLGKEPPVLKKFLTWDAVRGAFLSFERKRLSYLYITPIDEDKVFRSDNVKVSYVPVPKYIYSVIDFCALGGLLPDDVIYRLRYTAEHLHSSSRLTRLSAQSFLLIDTIQQLRLSGKMDQVQ
jgi:hypothetical protein